jgi:hypothetical protein
MSQKLAVHKDVQAVLLQRMAVSRTALLEANRLAASPPLRALARGSAANVVASLVDAPHVTLLLALVAGGIILGPRRTVRIAGRSGLTAWIARSVRQLVAGQLE